MPQAGEGPGQTAGEKELSGGSLENSFEEERPTVGKTRRGQAGPSPRKLRQLQNSGRKSMLSKQGLPSLVTTPLSKRFG